MKLKLKIILLIFFLLFTILTTFGYLLYYTNLRFKEVEERTTKYRELTLLNQELIRQQEITEFSIINFSFSKDLTAIKDINEAERIKDETTERIGNLVETEIQRKLLNDYVDSRKNISNLRFELLQAIQSNNENEIHRAFTAWNKQTNQIRFTISDLERENNAGFQNIFSSFSDIYRRITYIIFLSSLFTVIIIFIIYYWLSVKITNPITFLAKKADEIAQMNFTWSNKDKETKFSRDEIGILSRSILNMSDNLQNTYINLEAKVAERTKLLFKKTETLNLEREELLKTKALDSAILASIGDALAVIDTVGTITYVNQAFEAITGWKESESVGKIFTDLIPAEDESGNKISGKKRFISQIVAGHDPMEMSPDHTIYYQKKDGSRFPVRSLVKRITLGGVVIGAVKTFTDITNIKTIDNAKSEFVSLAAHQLRTPISAIGWYTEMLLSGDAGEISPEHKRYLDQIYNANQRMIAMVKSFLNVSRIEMGNLTIEKVLTDVKLLLEEVIEEQKQKLIEKELDFKLIVSENLQNIFLDAPKIRMVFQNLLSNAIKYSKYKGKVTIEMSIDLKANEFIVKFADNGYGIPDSDKDQIFTKLFRAKNVQELATDGTGLGLYVVKNFVDSSGGKIWFESEENKGTTFYLTLPL